MQGCKNCVDNDGDFVEYDLNFVKVVIIICVNSIIIVVTVSEEEETLPPYQLL
jgi:hypothetical protein